MINKKFINYKNYIKKSFISSGLMTLKILKYHDNMYILGGEVGEDLSWGR